MLIRKFFIVLSAVIFVGCSTTEDESFAQDYTEVMLYEAYIHKEPFAFFTVDNYYTTSMFEPENGVYLGAYILSNRHVDSNMEEFEELVGRKHALFTHKMRLGDPFPEEWLLKCIALMRTPNIILTYGNPDNPFEMRKITETAQQLGQFYVPMILHFFPEQRQHGFNPEEYIDFFRESRRIFAEYASNVAFVFTIFEDDVLDSDVFYPGDDYVDWVGINIFKSISEDGSPFIENTLNRFDVFYHTYGRNKPIIISGFGVSHFSTINHIYHPVLAGEQIQQFYQTILDSYPRVKAIIYMDVNTISNPTEMNYRDNFSVTANSIVLDFYRNVIQDERLLSYVDFGAGGQIIPQLVKSPFSAYKINENFYISKNILIYDFKKSNIAHLENYKLELNGDTYYNLSVLQVDSIHNIYIDFTQNRIIVN